MKTNKTQKQNNSIAKTRTGYNLSQRTTRLMAMIDVRQQLEQMIVDFEDAYTDDMINDCYGVIGIEQGDLDQLLNVSLQLDIADRRLNP